MEDRRSPRSARKVRFRRERHRSVPRSAPQGTQTSVPDLETSDRGRSFLGGETGRALGMRVMPDRCPDNLPIVLGPDR